MPNLKLCGFDSIAARDQHIVDLRVGGAKYQTIGLALNLSMHTCVGICLKAMRDGKVTAHQLGYKPRFAARGARV